MQRGVRHLRGHECGDWWPGDRVAYDAIRVTCLRCKREIWRQQDEARRRRAERSKAVRGHPPLPFADAPTGVCRLCGGTCTGRRRTWCGPECVWVWQCATSAPVARTALVGVLGDICWGCGNEPGTDVDHVRPLWSLTEAERLELRWWGLFNLQLLGPLCHKAKTRAEARQRALARRTAA